MFNYQRKHYVSCACSVLVSIHYVSWLGKLKHRREAVLETGCCFRGPYVCPNLLSRYQMPLMSFTDFGAGDVWMLGQAQASARGLVGDRMLLQGALYVCPNPVFRYQMPLVSFTDFGAGDVWMAGRSHGTIIRHQEYNLPSIKNSLSRSIFPTSVLIGIATSIRNVRIRTVSTTIPHSLYILLIVQRSSIFHGAYFLIP